MLRLNAAIGGRPETLMGLAGLGDLVLTCTGALSRNRRLGLALGRGQTRDDAVREIGQVGESVPTSNEVMRLARRYGLELTIYANWKDRSDKRGVGEGGVGRSKNRRAREQ